MQLSHNYPYYQLSKYISYHILIILSIHSFFIIPFYLSYSEDKLRKVTISKEHVDTIIQDFGIKKEIAERLLRVHENSLDAVYQYLIYGDAKIKTPQEAYTKTTKITNI